MLCRSNFIGYSPRRLFTILLILFGMTSFLRLIYLHGLLYKPPLTAIYRSIQAQVQRDEDFIPHLDQPTNSSIMRALLVFYPSNQEQHFLPELLWFFRSWIEMMKYEPPTWRTDLLIYTTNMTANLFDLGCSFNRIRNNRQELPQCRVFHYQRVSERDLSDLNYSHIYQFQQINYRRSRLITRYLKTYPYVDSINIINECYPSFAMYDYVLRTDLDTFLTKYFGQYVPANDTFLVGAGGYSTRFNTLRLKRIAHNMNWSYANLENLGSTWYASPKFVTKVANSTLYAMAYLAWSEFTEVEKAGKLGVLLWPEWHYGVLSLYGAHLTLNHLIESENLHLGLAHALLDQTVTSKDPNKFESARYLHLHCWHGAEPFSKFAFKGGQYNNLSSDMFRNDQSASGYAMRMALEAREFFTRGLHQLLLNITKTMKQI